MCCALISRPTLGCSDRWIFVNTFVTSLASLWCYFMMSSFPVYHRRHQTTGEAQAAPPTSLTLARRSFVTTTRTSQGQLPFRVHCGIQLSHHQRELEQWRAQMNWCHLLVHQDLHPRVRITIMLHYFLREGALFIP